MTKRPPAPNAKNDAQSLSRQVLATSVRVVRMPFEAIGRAVQVLFALFVLVLHPQIKWLAGIVARSRLIQNTLKPLLQIVITSVYDPYFAQLKTLTPFWATVSIAVPLAVLEPAKFLATVMIATHPRVGVFLWLALQGVSFVLIDKTWAAVRPQARKIRVVAYSHAWMWLNVERGKYWIKTSTVYKTFLRGKEAAVRRLRVFFEKIAPGRKTGPDSTAANADRQGTA